MKPLCIDLFCGLGGWTEGFLSEGWDVVGFDIERHQYGEHKYPAQLVIQDVLTLHGSQFRNAAVIVASPPCQAYSYRAMPWKRAKALPPPSNELFEACFRIASEAGVPLVIENVKGAQPWVGRAAWHYGSFYLWGDLPALMPMTLRRPSKNNGNGTWFNIAHGQLIPGNQAGAPQRGDGLMNRLSVAGIKVPGNDTFKKNGAPCGKLTDPRYPSDGVKIGGSGDEYWRKPLEAKRREATAIKNGGDWFSAGDEMSAQRRHNSKSSSRKAASAMIAKIPFELSSHIARCFKPRTTAA